MDLVLLGPPGSGKGTQAERLTQAYQIPAISTGEILRAQRLAGTRLGRQARAFMDRGELVPDDVVIGIIGHRLDEPDTQTGFILDGFPRTVAQAQALDTLLAQLERPIDAVVYLEIGRQALLDRLGHRHRSDDRPEIVAHRIDVYLEQTAPLIDYYRERGTLRAIDADQTEEVVFASITSRLG
jgi:adenylate kinase